MNLRSLVLLLVLANVVFFAWAHFVDVPTEIAPVDTTKSLPRLRLASEEFRAESSSAASQSSSSASQASVTTSSGATPAALPPATPAALPAATPAALPAATPAGAGTSMSATGSSATATAARATPIAGAATAAGAPSARCITVGPFNDAKRAAEAERLLGQRGFAPRERSGTGPPDRRYWVVVRDLGSEAEERQVLQRLQSSGIADARSMPDGAQGRRVSVGLFSERSGAERRARAVRALGLGAAIEERIQSEPTHWVDVDLSSSTQTLPMDGLLSLEENGSKLEIKSCPGAVSG